MLNYKCYYKWTKAKSKSAKKSWIIQNTVGTYSTQGPKIQTRFTITPLACYPAGACPADLQFSTHGNTMCTIPWCVLFIKYACKILTPEMWFLHCSCHLLINLQNQCSDAYCKVFEAWREFKHVVYQLRYMGVSKGSWQSTLNHIRPIKDVTKNKFKRDNILIYYIYILLNI